MGDNTEYGPEPAPFCEAISWAIAHFQDPDRKQLKCVASAVSLLESGEIVPDSFGLDGMNDVASFEVTDAHRSSFAVGSRVKAMYRGTWYVATVKAPPDDRGMWKVHCDV